MTNAYCAEVKQGGCAWEQQQTEQQKEPGEKPNWQTPQQPPLGHLATLGSKQGQLDG